MSLYPKAEMFFVGGLVKDKRTLQRDWLSLGAAFIAFVHCFGSRRKLFVPECFASGSDN
jgi:hypothetical protein